MFKLYSSIHGILRFKQNVAPLSMTTSVVIDIQWIWVK